MEQSTQQPEVESEKDIANKDAFCGAGGYAVPVKVKVTYLAVFDNEEQLKAYHHYIRLLKKRYPDVRTIGGRISKHLAEDVVPGLEKQYGKARKKSGKDWPVGHAPHEDVEIVKEDE